MSGRWRGRWRRTASPAGGRPSPRSSGAIPRASTRAGWRGRRWRASPRTSRTRWWRRCSGWRSAGVPGAAAYKAINTADSMIGHRSERHRAFGWAAARVDDLVNLPASRLSAVLLVAAAALLPGASARGAWAAVRRDARGHRSPNAGWPEAAMAGALGFALAGPRRYGGVLVEDATMGAGGRRELGAADIRRGAAALPGGGRAAAGTDRRRGACHLARLSRRSRSRWASRWRARPSRAASTPAS